MKFIEVLDFKDPELWLPILKENNIGYIIHLATPKPRDFTGDDEAYVSTAIHMNLGILDAASKTEGVKRVVITSSMVAVRDGKGPKERAASGDSRLPMPEGPPYHDQNARYTASKIAALSAIDSFVSSNSEIHFKVINIMPGFVVGPQLLATSSSEMLKSSNRAVLIPVTRGTLPYIGTGRYVSLTVHLDDVVDLHLESLISDKLEGRKEWGFAVAGMDGGDYESIPDVTRKLFPDAVRSRRLKFTEDGQEGEGEGKGKVLVYDVDVEGAEMVLGRKLKGLKEQVRDVVGCYLELLAEEAQG
ncbi:NAD(P)-binding protein [Acephala macrosclerotiorum]|nr:NAD(P)-binding protein [Acephala macrosclerotiorum]